VTDSESPTKDTNEVTGADSPQAETPQAEAPPTETPPTEVAAATATEEAADVVPPPSSGTFWGTGRRKSAVARVRLTPGEGKIVVNKREIDSYFHEPHERLAVRESLIATKTEGAFDVFVNVSGGGHNGQADAIRLGMARALVRADGRYEAALREKGYLTRDARIVERKKYGQRKARRRFQFSKR
jgi:small subunit ribosomal protein S9